MKITVNYKQGDAKTIEIEYKSHEDLIEQCNTLHGDDTPISERNFIFECNWEEHLSILEIINKELEEGLKSVIWQKAGVDLLENLKLNPVKLKHFPMNSIGTIEFIDKWLSE